MCTSTDFVYSKDRRELITVQWNGWLIPLAGIVFANSRRKSFFIVSARNNVLLQTRGFKNKKTLSVGALAATGFSNAMCLAPRSR
jgi:hypothetical protein